MNGAEAKPTLPRATAFWLKLGCISFGGPAGQIALMHEELVDRRAWIDERSFLNALNFCMMLPGPEAQQLATYIGWRLNGIPGGLIAGALFILPSFALLLGLSWIYVTFGHAAIVEGVLRGIKPVVTAIVVQAVWKICTRAFGSPIRPRLVLVALAAFLAILVFNVPFPLVVFGAGLIGLADREPATMSAVSPSLSIARILRCIAVALIAWSVPILLLRGELSRIAWFFSKAAVVGFGGAYALLPYINQAAIQFGWLTPPQMMDGLALGETTPGPLLMIVEFVGYLASGPAGAAVAVWFTFLPSFFFVLTGAPIVDHLASSNRLRGPLRAVTAAVAGVIANLAVLFGRNVLIGAEPLLLALAACVALFYFKRSAVETIVGGAVVGLLLGLS